MEREELIKALRRMMPETGSLHCLGCGYEHNCSLHGCAIIREAMEEIMRLAVENEALRRGADAPDRPMSQAERDALLEWPDSLPLTLRQAAGILRNANLGGVLRAAADMGIEALENEMGGANEAD